jgi:hypothetical protein
MAGRLRDRQSGQTGGYRVRTSKGKNQEDEKKRNWKKQELRHKTLVGFNKQDEHRG